MKRTLHSAIGSAVVALLGGVSFGAPLRVEPGEGKAEFLLRARDAVNALRHL